MKKRLIIAVTMVALVAVFASAQAWNGREPGMMGDQGSGHGGFGPMHAGQRGVGLDSQEMETVSGPIRLQEGQLPSVTSGDTTYSLHIPPILTEEVSIRDGQQITVEGYATREQTILRVRAIESDGTRVIVPAQRDQRSFSARSSFQRAPTRGGRR